MIVVDANIWIDHLRQPDSRLNSLMRHGRALMHPYTIGEIALGALADREAVLGRLSRLPSPPVSSHDDVLALIDGHILYGCGVGYVDAHLLGSTLLVPNGSLWTRDKRLRRVAERFSVAADLD